MIHSKSLLFDVIIVFIFLSFSNSSFAHFNPVVNRSVHVVFDDNLPVTEIYVRIPLPLLIITSDWAGGSSGDDLEWAKQRRIENQWRYYLDEDLVNQNWSKFINFALRDYSVNNLSEAYLNSSVQEVNIHSEHYGQGFSTLQSALSTFDRVNDITLPADKEVFDAVVDFHILIDLTDAKNEFSIVSDQGRGLGVENKLFNHLFFYSRRNNDDVDVLDIRHDLGVLNDSFQYQRPIVERFSLAIYHGIEHIILGWDHLLFIVLLVLVSNSVKQVLKRATVFTVGHSITLSLGIFGIIPSGNWFIPLIESLIAASIVLAGVFILMDKSSKFNSKICLGLGLIHGFGFSFVVKDSVFQQQTIDYFNLIGINVGIELGQIMIYLVVLPMLYYLPKFVNLGAFITRKVTAVPCLVIAGYWMFVRLLETSEYVL